MKGIGRTEKPLFEVSKRPLAQHRVHLYTVGVDAAKEMFLMSRVRIENPGRGYCHWTADGNYPNDYFLQLSFKRRILAYLHDRPVHRCV